MNDDLHVMDLLPGLALGSLDSVEARTVREHLARCSKCRDELAELEEVTGRLALALPSADPPAVLEDRLMERVRQKSSRPRFAIFRHPAWGAAAALLIVLLGAGNAIQLYRGAAAARTPVAPGFFTIVLRGGDSSRPVTGTMVLDSHSHGGTLAMRGLPRLDPDHQYQLWLVRNGERISGGVFSPDEYGYGNLLLLVPKEFRDFTSIGVSVEPAGGSPSPTGPRVAAGKL